MSHRNRKSRNKSVRKTSPADFTSVTAEEISRNSAVLSSDSTSVQSDFSDFFDDIKNSYLPSSSADEEELPEESMTSVNDSAVADFFPDSSSAAQTANDTSEIAPENSLSASGISENDTSIDFSSLSWKDDLFHSVGYTPESDSDPVSPPVAAPDEIEAESVGSSVSEDSALRLSDSLTYEEEPGLAVPQTPHFLSFVDNDANDSLSARAAAVHDVFPSSRLEDIIAELSGTSYAAITGQEIPGEESILTADADVDLSETASDIEDKTTYTLDDILEEAADSKYISSDDILHAASEKSSFDSVLKTESAEPSAAVDKISVSAGPDHKSAPDQQDSPFDFDRDFDSLREEFSGLSSDASADLPLSSSAAVSAAASVYSLDSILSGIDSLAEDEGPEIDDRFNLSGQAADTIRFGGVQVDTSADPSYTPHLQKESYKSGYADGKAPKDFSEQGGFLGGFLGRRDSSKLAEVRDILSGKKKSADTSADRSANQASDSESAASFDSIDPVPEYDFSYTPDQSAFEASIPSAGDEEDDTGDAAASSASVDDIISSFYTGTDKADTTPESTGISNISGSSSEESETESNSPESSSDAPSEGYLHDTDYDYSEPDGDDFETSSAGVDYFPSTFREYILTGITAILYRMRPGSRAGSATIEDKNENLGAEVSPVKASRYYASYSNSLRNRLRISVILLLVMAYISSGLPCSGMLKTKTGASEFCLAAQLTVMMLSLDVVTAGIMDLVRRKPGAASLAVVSCVFTSLDSAISAIGKVGTLHMPLCVLSSFSLVGILFASLLHSRGMHKALRVPAIGKRVYTVTGEMNVRPREITLLKSVRPCKGFVRRAEEAAPDEEFFIKAWPFIFLLAVFLGIILTIAGKSFSDLIYYISAMLAVSVPFTSLVAYALPFHLGSYSLFHSGAAIAGWSGLSDIGRSKNLVITDRDLFPDDSVKFESIRIFADEENSDEENEKVISYAGTMATASGSCLSRPFADLMLRRNYRTCHVEHFEYLSGGGMKGIIEGDVVILGNSDMLRLLNIRIPYRWVSKYTVLLAINGVVSGIFNMKYTAAPSVRDALVKLIGSDRHPIFAIRDFNVTPEMIHDIYDLATDGYDFPPYIERYRISAAEPSEDSKIAAVVCREGLGPLIHLADTGHSMYRSVVANCIITVACAVVGMLAMFIAILAAGSISIKGFLLFMIVSALPVFFISVYMKN